MVNLSIVFCSFGCIIFSAHIIDIFVNVLAGGRKRARSRVFEKNCSAPIDDDNVMFVP